MREMIGRALLWVATRVAWRVRRVIAWLLKTESQVRAPAVIPQETERADLAGQVVIVTGSTQGIGLALARACAAGKAKVVVNGRTASGVAAAVRGIRDAGGVATGVCADVSTEEGAAQLLQATLQTFGRVDVLVNNAGVTGPYHRRVWEVTPAEWHDTLGVNLTGSFLCARQVAAWMLNNGAMGRIINVSSGAAETPVSGLVPYVVSKVALESLTRGMAIDVGWDGLTVTAIELGSVQTRLTREYFGEQVYQRLPPPETAVPIFLHAMTAPRQQVHGRILAAWRHAKDPEAEAVLTGPLVMADRATFPPLRRGDQEVNRTDPGLVVLDRAENPLGMPERVRLLLRRAAHEMDFARYPDQNHTALRQALSSRLKLPEGCFTFGNGSVELVERAVRSFSQRGEEVISNEPSWFMFDRFCHLSGVANRKVPFRSVNGAFDHNLEGVAQAIGVNTRLVYLVSPSNPMGVGISGEAFRRFLEHVPPHIPIVVDEAYLDYSTRPETLRSHEVILGTDRRVIGFRTFSKFYGLAGLRIGYAFARPETLRLLTRLEPTFPLSSLAEAAAVAALEDEEHATRTLGMFRSERTRIEARLAAAGLAYVPSETSVMLVECPGPADELFRRYEDAGIFLPRGLLMDRYILFPIARPEQNDRNLEILCAR